MNRKLSLVVLVTAAASLLVVTGPTRAAQLGLSRSAVTTPGKLVEEVQHRRDAGVVRRGPPGFARHGVRPGPVVVRPGFRPGPTVVVRRGGWGRPRHFWWGVGGAVAAGAALGYVVASAAPWAGPPPGPGLCWYYTDWSRRGGFWDVCPY